MTAPPRRPRAVVFDLDETLLDSRRAWIYAVEEALLTVSGSRINAAELVAEYRRRPWRHVFSVLVPGGEDATRGAETAEAMFHRSALKRLLVHEGIGMGLDRVRVARIEIGVISREPHSHALRQIESTGLDRFVTVLSPTPRGEPWAPDRRIGECLAYLGREPSDCAFIGADASDVGVATEAGMKGFFAAWAEPESQALPRIGLPAEIEAALTSAWQ